MQYRDTYKNSPTAAFAFSMVMHKHDKYALSRAVQVFERRTQNKDVNRIEDGRKEKVICCGPRGKQ